MPAAIDHTPPIPMPTSTRAATMTAKPGASAAARLPTVSTVNSTAHTVFRSTRPRAGVSSGAATAATSPVMVRVSPPTPSLTRRSALIGVSRPTGSISEVTTVKVAPVTAATPSQPRTTRPVSGGVCRRSVMVSSQGSRGRGNNDEALTVR